MKLVDIVVNVLRDTDQLVIKNVVWVSFAVKPVFHQANLFARTEKEATRLAGDKH